METSEYLEMLVAALNELEQRQYETQQTIIVICCFLGVIAGLLLIRILFDRM